MLDYGRRPVGDLLRGPLLHTPQGIVLVIVAGVYWVAAMLFWSGVLAPVPSVESPALVCALWPLLMFVMFVYHSSPGFAPSWWETGWTVVYALLPVVFFFFWGWP
jgi:hypothetical protein